MLVNIALSSLAVAIGIAFALQAGINAALARGVGSVLVAATVSFSMGCVALAAAALLGGQLQMAAGSTRSLPLWMWMAGGLLGAGIVYFSVFLVPRIGVAALAAFIIAGQLTATAVIDHYGLLGVPVHPMNLWRSVGIALLLGGAVMVRAA